MKAFLQSKLNQFVRSATTARHSRNCPLDSETTDSWVHRRYWSVHPLICGWDGYLNYTETLVDNSGYGDIESVGSDYDVSRQWYAIQGGYVNVPRGPTSGINFRSRGKWKIDFTLRVFRAKVAHPESPERNWLFFNLIRRAKDYSVSGDNPNLSALIRHVSGPVVIQDEPTLTRESEIIGGTPSDGVPAEAIPLTGANPADVLCTWKMDVSGISPTPASPYVFTDTLIVPETLEFCRVMFDVTPYEFGDSTQTIGTNVIDPYPAGTYYVSNTDSGSFGSSPFVGYVNNLSYLTLPEGASQPALPSAIDLTVAFDFFNTYAGDIGTVFMPMRNGQDVALTGTPSDVVVVHSLQEILDIGGPTPRVVWFNSNFVVGEQIITAHPGQWDVPLIPALSGGAVDLAVTYVDGQPWTIAPDINAALAANPGWNGETQPDGQKGHSLWEIEVRLTRIAPLTCLFKALRANGGAYNLSDISLGDPIRWQWDFGDGVRTGGEESTGSEGSTGDGSYYDLQNPGLHYYANPGSYRVTLTIWNSIGEMASHSTVVTVDLIAAFALSTSAADTGEAITFTDFSQGAIASRLWNFGDGTTSTDVNPSHAYTTAGTKNVTLTLTSPGGATDVVTHAVTVSAFSCDFSFVVSTIAGGNKKIILTGTAIVGIHGPITAWTWVLSGFFQSGALGQTATVFSSPGHQVTATLTITNSIGKTASKTKTFFV